MSFLKNTDGNFSIMFAVGSMLLVGSAGVAVQIMTMEKQDNYMQNSLDNAVLAAAIRMEGGSPSDKKAVETYGEKLFMAEASNGNLECEVKHLNVLHGPSVIMAKTECKTNSIFPLMNHLIPSSIQVDATASYGGNAKYELALMLDASGSMGGSRMSTLKASVDDMIDTLIPEAGGSNVRISLAPYSSSVNAGIYGDVTTGIEDLYSHTISNLGASSSSVFNTSSTSNAPSTLETNSLAAAAPAGLSSITMPYSGFQPGTGFPIGWSATTSVTNNGETPPKDSGNSGGLPGTGSGSGGGIPRGETTDQGGGSPSSGGDTTGTSTSANDIVIIVDDQGRPTAVPYSGGDFNLPGGTTYTPGVGLIPDAIQVILPDGSIAAANGEGACKDCPVFPGTPTQVAVKWSTTNWADPANLNTFDWSLLGNDYAANVGTTACVTERTGNEAFTDTSPIGHPVGAEASQCPVSAVEPLTDDRDLLHDGIDALVANGGTAGHLGIAWSWYTLSPEWSDLWAPNRRTESDNPDVPVERIAVLMTDGSFNNVYESATLGSSKEQSEELCDGMKADNITVYAIAFSAPSSGQAIMQYCATTPDHYFNVNTSQEVQMAYQNIASNLGGVRLTR